MAKRGRRATPQAILRLRGSTNADRRQEPIQFPADVPEPPDWLQGEGRREWGRIVGLIAPHGLMSPAYQVPLALYCQAYADYLAAQAEIARDGRTILNDKGVRIPHPAVAQAERAWRCTMKGAAEFGLTPAAITGLAPRKPKSAADGKARFFQPA